MPKVEYQHMGDITDDGSRGMERKIPKQQEMKNNQTESKITHQLR